MSDTNSPILSVRKLKRYFPIRRGVFRRTVGFIKAVDGVDFDIDLGETLGLVGESGCGKTTTGRCILRAIEPTEGEILYQSDGSRSIDVQALSREGLREFRRNVQMIFQDPYASLNPRLSVLDTIAEPIRAHKLLEGKALEDRVKELMTLVGLDMRYLRRYPHAFSGGQRQRIGVARALALNPELLVADEPVSALDVSVQAQILNLLKTLQRKFRFSYLFIAHDLSVVKHISDRVAVMYLGKIVEVSETNELFRHPLHPYTEALLSAVPKPNPRIKGERIVLSGQVPDAAAPPSGCSFHTRCRYAIDRCKTEVPMLEDVQNDHSAACHRFAELSLKGIVERSH